MLLSSFFANICYLPHWKPSFCRIFSLCVSPWMHIPYIYKIPPVQVQSSNWHRFQVNSLHLISHSINFHNQRRVRMTTDSGCKYACVYVRSCHKTPDWVPISKQAPVGCCCGWLVSMGDALLNWRYCFVQQIKIQHKMGAFRVSVGQSFYL